MNRHFLQAFLLLFAISLSHICCSSASASSSEESSRWNFLMTLVQECTGERVQDKTGRSTFPVLPEFVKGLGKPQETVIADDEYCLLGQVHRWCFTEQNLMPVVLGDNFGSVADYAAGSRMFALRKCSAEKETSFPGIWGIRLGDSDSTVREKLEALSRQSKHIALSKDAEEAPIHVFLYDFNIMHQYIVRKGDLFFYFMINRKGLLEVIVISRFDVMRAC